MKKGFTISELVLVFAIVIGVVLLIMPVVMKTNERMDRIECANNMYQIGLALYIYAREHDGMFPKDLDTLYAEEYLSDKDLLACPASKRKGAGKADQGYIYTGGLSVKDPFSIPLLQDKQDNHPNGGKNVLYVSGEVEWKK
ncbi:MAG: type II secretion system protein [Candidatus Omnitrophica bacterium]|nr:type II secretion system protein [Candidatus Omnitrophota bacterium]MDD5488325.1 type II secretion system protein [Candidatus Omnitrophota bacterium]